jgi:hypothetical protein
MRLPLTGFAFLLGYIVMVGVASFLEKFSMKQLNPYQVNFLMAIGMAVTAVPALWIKQGSLTVPAKALPLGSAHRAFDGARLHLFRPRAVEAARGDGDRHFYQLRPAGVVTLLVVLKRGHELDEDCGRANSAVRR